MKTNLKALCLLIGISTFTWSAAVAKPGGGNGTDILHLTVTSSMDNEGGEPGAAGTVKASQNTQGNADHHRLDVAVRGLTPNTSYELYAGIDDDTNLTSVAQFTTDANGNATLRYQSHGNGNSKSKGKGKTPLPAELVPLSNVSEIAVGTVSNVLLSADLGEPDKLQYLLKRNLSDNGVSASLRIKATTSQTQFRLTASSLAATNDYYLVINDAPVQTQTSDANGSLVITSLLNPVDILEVNSVALWDSSSNVVVSTTLP